MANKCKLPKCDNVSRALGLCRKHYTRLRRYGDPLGEGPQKRRRLRWLKETSRYQGDECKLWPFAKSESGYGVFTWGGSYHAHRVMCKMVYGAAPTPRHRAAHSCPHKDCMTPSHLSWKLRGKQA